MSSVLLERSLLLILVSRLVFNVVCVTGEIRVGHLSFTSCVSMSSVVTDCPFFGLSFTVQCRLCY